ncbi:hypothetical protein V7306_08070, partial [Neobacillus vireti]
MNQVVYYFKRLHIYSGKILYFNIFCMGIVSFLEGIGILLLVPMISYSGIVNVDFGGFKYQKYLYFLQAYSKTEVLIFILGI